jgi:hypothetical protein
MKSTKLVRVFAALALAVAVFVAARGLSQMQRPVASRAPQAVAWLTIPLPGGTGPSNTPPGGFTTESVNWNG